MKRTLNYPPVWLLGFMAAGWAIAAVHAPLGDAFAWPGGALIALGVLLGIWAALAFRRARTTIVPHEVPSALVDTGPFRYSRNPIYLADMLVLFGWGLSLGAPIAMLLVWPFQVVLTRLFIEPEEDRLNGALGEPYRLYCMQVRRWV